MFCDTLSFVKIVYTQILEGIVNFAPLKAFALVGMVCCFFSMEASEKQSLKQLCSQGCYDTTLLKDYLDKTDALEIVEAYSLVEAGFKHYACEPLGFGFFVNLRQTKEKIIRNRAEAEIESLCNRFTKCQHSESSKYLLTHTIKSLSGCFDHSFKIVQLCKAIENKQRDLAKIWISLGADIKAIGTDWKKNDIICAVSEARFEKMKEEMNALKKYATSSSSNASSSSSTSK